MLSNENFQKNCLNLKYYLLTTYFKKKKKFATAKFIMSKEKSVILWYVPKATDVKEIIRTLLTVILKQK